MAVDQQHQEYSGSTKQELGGHPGC
jgi:hypothetical protein